MVSSKNIKEILKSISQSNQSFVILEDGQPKYVVLEYSSYERFISLDDEKNKPSQLLAAKSESVLIIGQEDRLVENFVKKASRLFENVFLVGYKKEMNLRNVEKISFDTNVLEKVFAEKNIKSVFYIDTKADENFKGKAREKEPLIEKLKKVVNILDKIKNLDNAKFIYVTKGEDFTTAGKSRIILEKVLEYYHQSYNLDSLSLRLPCIYQEENKEIEDLDSLLFDDPVSAIIFANKYHKDLCVPYEESFSLDGTPMVEIISLEDALEAMFFSQRHLNESSGSIVCQADGIKTTLGTIIDNVLVKSGKMIITTHVALEEKWQQRQQEEKKIKSLSEYGWQPKNSELLDLLTNITPDTKGNGDKNKLTEEIEKQPISIRDLLSGRQTPFIKPHNS